MLECNLPHNSLHCPIYHPGALQVLLIEFSRPGFASALTPRDGKANECTTSFEEVKNNRVLWTGKINRSLLSANGKISASLTVILSKLTSISGKLYSQYH